jgi:EAL domain-containing protein (putative c-di-GMP-specific phosphodiesterase class I)
MLKIDRSFVDGIEARAECRSIASMIVKMGHELGFSVLAEGVETVAQEAVLRELGCDSVQGFLYARPLPPEELAPWLKSRAFVA